MFFGYNTEAILRKKNSIEEIIETCKQDQFISFCKNNPDLIYEIILNNAKYKTTGYKFLFNRNNFKYIFDNLKKLSYVNPNLDIIKKISKPFVTSSFYREIEMTPDNEIRNFIKFNGFPIDINRVNPVRPITASIHHEFSFAGKSTLGGKLKKKKAILKVIKKKLIIKKKSVKRKIKK